VPDVGAVRFGRCGPKRPKKNSQNFPFFFREVTPDSPSPRKPHINTGSRSNTAPFSQMPVWGVFGVRGKFGPRRRSRPGPGGRTSVADAPDPRRDGTAGMAVAHSARNYEPTGLGSGCRRGRWGVTGVSSVWGVGPIWGWVGAHAQAWLMRRIHGVTARQGWQWPTAAAVWGPALGPSL
jgi:hypothetical protein